YSIENPLKNAGLHPIAIALEHRIPVAERRRQISPWAARARDPKHSFEKQTVVTPCATGVRGLAQTKRLHLRPLSVRQNESVHPKLLSELESWTFQSVNPESQQTLVGDYAIWMVIGLASLSVFMGWPARWNPRVAAGGDLPPS